MTTTRWSLVGLAVLAVIAVAILACRKYSGDATVDSSQGGSQKIFVPDSPELIDEYQKGVGLLEMYYYGEANELFAKLAADHPNWIDAKLALAIALLNFTQRSDEALPVLEQVLKLDPSNDRAAYCTAILLIHDNRKIEALPYLEAIHRHDDKDPYVTFQIAQCVEETSTDEALDWYLKTIKLDPYFRSAYFRCAEIYRLQRNKDESAKYRQSFERLGNSALGHAFDWKYNVMGTKATAVPFVQRSSASQNAPSDRLFDSMRPLLLGDSLTFKPTAGANITACDIDGDGKTDLFLTGMLNESGARQTAVLLQLADGTFAWSKEHPLSNIENVHAALWGDIDNDGLTDLYLCRSEGNQLWRQQSDHSWQDISESAGTIGTRGNCIDGALVDADHDSDLDIFLVYEEGPNELLNNNGNLTFRAIGEQVGLSAEKNQKSRGVLFADLDGDFDRDIIIIHDKPPHEVLINDRGWKYHIAEPLPEFANSEMNAAVAIDADLDGLNEVFALGSDGLKRWSRGSTETWTGEVLDADVARDAQALRRLAVVDFDGNGSLELIAGAHSWKLVGAVSGASPPKFSDNVPALASWLVVNGDAAQGPSIVGWTQDGQLVIWPRTDAGSFLVVGLTARKSGSNREKSNVSGIGTRIEVHKGKQVSIAENLGWQSGPGQSLQPLNVGLMGNKSCDYVLLHWPDAVTQAEIKWEWGKRHDLQESDRLPTSCPLLFVWNGTRYEFVSDVLSVGGVGYFVSPGVTGTPDPTENFLLPEGMLAVSEGRLRLKLLEPMPELTYLDSAELVAYDIPPGWQMALDERLATGSPEPSGDARYFRRLQSPGRVTNDRNEDVTHAVAAADYEAAPPGPLDMRFVGRLEREHVLTMTFEEPIAQGGGSPILIADGWVEFPYSQTLYAAWQSGAEFQPPTLEARSPSGEWQTVHAQFGYPGGMPRQMSVPIDGLPSGTTELRLRTNLEIYWDRLAIVDTEPCDQVSRQSLALLSAQVADHGCTPRHVLSQYRPTFDYYETMPHPGTRDPAGYYTAFGEATPLVQKADDAVAIFGPGEEIQLEFAASLRPVPEGWTRRYVLQLLGWCKDTDLYTENGMSVEPLPSRGLNNPQRDALHQKYNTRFQSGR